MSRLRIPWLFLGTIAAAMLIVPTVPSAAAPQPVAGKKTTVLDVRDEAALTITGGYSVSAAGDVNGDGIPDFTIVNPDYNSGGVYVIFGDASVERIELPLIGVNGFVIAPRSPLDEAWFADGAGDVNGDGLDDIVVGAPAHEGDGTLAGRGYVVFGKSDPAPVPLALFDADIQGPLGFRIDAAAPVGLLGQDVAGLGDVNGDGLSDVAVGAPFLGRTYVVFGKENDVSPVRLSDFEEDRGGGFRIKHLPSESSIDYHLTAAGDVNGDGLADLTVGVYQVDEVQDDVIQALVIYGKKRITPVDTLKRTFAGVRLRGSTPHHSGVGDLNGDGFDDVVGRLYRSLENGWPGYIVLGRKGGLPSHPGKGGIAFSSSDGYAAGIGILSPALDFNGDGVADFMTGWFSARDDAGLVTVVFGARKVTTFELGKLARSRGVAFTSRAADRLGASIAGLGDLDGDGFDDILIGAAGAREAYIVLGRR